MRPDIESAARFASWALIGAALVAACNAQQLHTAETAADVALAGINGSCVRIHDEDVDAGPVLAVICRDEATLSANLGDGGFVAINPAVAVRTVTAIVTSRMPADAGGQ